MADTLTRGTAPPAPPAEPPATRPRHPLVVIGWSWFKRSAAIVVFLLLWEAAPRVGLVDRVFLPPLSEVLVATADLASSGQLWAHVSASLSRALAGFVLAVVVAVPLGLLIAWYRPVSDFLMPVLELFRNTAALALLPVFVLILGIGEASKVALVVFACTFPILLNTVTGVRTVDPLLVKAAVSLGFGPLALFRKVIVPAAVPSIFTGIRMAGAASILVLVAAEMVGAQSGLGYLINSSQLNFQIHDMYAGILSIALLGVTLNGGLVVLERRLSRWRTTTG
ncbi:ABC transporter permease [Nocardiopsis sp. L17-MgMaSL7]|uniref:ABC transporter permease n=1 Tax=Nocardiopsis sp. L17-MgMaSL7 TaxID=1938893 RepID=UPI000D714865|nr:ABC transporter permease [Nocardiopsis sp. L17-MgMaSL7]PWV50248.1 NitT/TauT family transport system permease protein [Nocardiopsis sp. L17-MgMaSL7]